VALLIPADERGERRRLALVLAFLALAYVPTLSTFVGTWTPSYREHGFAVAALTAWLIWRDREAVRRGAGQGVPALALAGLALSVAWLVAVTMDAAMIHQLLFTAIMASWALATFGWSARVPVIATWATFTLASPVWGFISPVLQRITTVMSGSLARGLGVSAQIQGDTITIASGTFLIEAGCSGINYLMAGLTLGAIYAHLFARHWKTQLEIVGVAGFASMVGNWIRVAVLVLIGDAQGIDSPLIEDHLWQGWAIFVVLMIPTYYAVRRVQHRDARRTAGVEVEAETPEGKVASFDPTRPRRAAKAAAYAAVGPAAYLLVGLFPTHAADRTLAPVGLEASGPVQERPAAAGWQPAFTGVDETLRWALALPDANVEIARLLFADQRQGEELVQWNNRIAPDSLLLAERVVGPVGQGRRYVREAIVLEAAGPRIAWYWYRVGGIDTPFATNAKLLELVAFFRRSGPSELVVLSAACAPGDCRDAARALRRALEGESPGA
jgi:exosortase